MSAFPGPANAIFYAQFNLRGGWKNTLAVAAGYALLVGGAMYLTANATTVRSYAAALRGWLNGLIALQVFILTIYGSFRVSASVRGDITSRILESHRLMPASAFSAVMGYLVGGPFQAMSLAVVNVVLGLFACPGAGINPQCWIVANMMLGATVMLSWTIVEQIAFTTRGGFVLLILGVVGAGFGNFTTMVLLPGVSVLTCPLVGRSVLSLTATFQDLSFAFGVALTAQFVFGAIFFRASMRKYRAPDAVAFSTMLGLLLLVVWVVISEIGIFRLEEFVAPWFFRQNDVLPVAQLVATLLVTMLIGILPVCSAARGLADWRRHGGPTANQPRRPISLAVVITATAAIACLLLIAEPGTIRNRTAAMIAVTQSAVIVFAFLIGIGLLFRWIYLITTRGWLVAVIWIVLTWILPMLADLMYHALMPEPPDSMTMVSSLSPIGALSLIWKPPDIPVNVKPGIVFQCAMVMLPAMLCFMGNRRDLVLSEARTRAQSKDLAV